MSCGQDVDLPVTARLVFIHTIHHGKSFQALFCVLCALCGNGIMRPLSLFSAHHDTAVAEYLHVVRERGLGDIHFLQQTAGAFLAALQKLQDTNAVFIAESLKNNRGSFYVIIHFLTSHRISSMYYYTRSIEICQYVNMHNVVMFRSFPSKRKTAPLKFIPFRAGDQLILIYSKGRVCVTA